METSAVNQAALAAARAGDEQAFVRLTAPHRQPLHRHCYRILGSLHDADDALQETMLRAWRGIDAIEAGRACPACSSSMTCSSSR